MTRGLEAAMKSGDDGIDVDWGIPLTHKEIVETPSKIRELVQEHTALAIALGGAALAAIGVAFRGGLIAAANRSD